LGGSIVLSACPGAPIDLYGVSEAATPAPGGGVDDPLAPMIHYEAPGSLFGALGSGPVFTVMFAGPGDHPVRVRLCEDETYAEIVFRVPEMVSLTLDREEVCPDEPFEGVLTFSEPVTESIFEFLSLYVVPSLERLDVRDLRVDTNRVTATLRLEGLIGGGPRALRVSCGEAAVEAPFVKIGLGTALIQDVDDAGNFLFFPDTKFQIASFLDANFQARFNLSITTEPAGKEDYFTYEISPSAGVMNAIGGFTPGASRVTFTIPGTFEVAVHCAPPAPVPVIAPSPLRRRGGVKWAGASSPLSQRSAQQNGNGNGDGDGAGGPKIRILDITSLVATDESDIANRVESKKGDEQTIAVAADTSVGFQLDFDRVTKEQEGVADQGPKVRFVVEPAEGADPDSGEFTLHVMIPYIGTTSIRFPELPNQVGPTREHTMKAFADKNDNGLPNDGEAVISTKVKVTRIALKEFRAVDTTSGQKGGKTNEAVAKPPVGTSSFSICLEAPVELSVATQPAGQEAKVKYAITTNPQNGGAPATGVFAAGKPTVTFTVPAYYFITAWLDSDGDGVQDPDEPWLGIGIQTARIAAIRASSGGQTVQDVDPAREQAVGDIPTLMVCVKKGDRVSVSVDYLPDAVGPTFPPDASLTIEEQPPGLRELQPPRDVDFTQVSTDRPGSAVFRARCGAQEDFAVQVFVVALESVEAWATSSTSGAVSTSNRPAALNVPIAAIGGTDITLFAFSSLSPEGVGNPSAANFPTGQPTWSKVEGPASGSFSSTVGPVVTYSGLAAPGRYILRAACGDSMIDVVVNVAVVSTDVNETDAVVDDALLLPSHPSGDKWNLPVTVFLKGAPPGTGPYKFLLSIDPVDQARFSRMKNLFTLDAAQRETRTISPEKLSLAFQGTTIRLDRAKAPNDVGRFTIFDLTVRDVTFSGPGFNVVTRDDGTDYAGPHWLDANGDGVADVKGTASLPIAVCYQRASSVKLSATLACKPDLTGLGADLSVDGPKPTALATPVVFTGPTASVGPITSASALKNKIDSQPSFDLTWKIAVKKGDKAATFGVSSNRMYVTLGTPVGLGAFLYETALDIGCRNAKGKEAENPAFDAIWSDFTDRDVRRVDGRQMKYWLDAADPDVESIGGASACQTLAGMLAPSTTLNGVGTCAAWADLLIATTQAQGISSAERIQITTSDKNDFDNPTPFRTPLDSSLLRHGVLMVKNRTFPPPNPALVGCAPFDRFRAAVASNPGAPAQGIGNPPDDFFNHFIVKYSGKFYDSSYGTGPFATNQEWQNASLAGVSKFSSCSPVSAAALARTAPATSTVVKFDPVP
ncbi:MAG: hypothetical protein HY719_16610, partial [Planctomycetes bacterium]|nr:hypothetical protein [Planctomycetota bacterium]